LRVRIARGRSCASILIIPQRKTVLVRALHGRRPWPNLSSMKHGHGGSPERKGRAREERGRGHDCWLGGRGLGVPWGGAPTLVHGCCALRAVRDLCMGKKGKRGERKRKGRKREKEKERKEKMENLLN
jgi:hypothetical protein